MCVYVVVCFELMHMQKVQRRLTTFENSPEMLTFFCIFSKMKSQSNLIFKAKSNGIVFDTDFILKTTPKKSWHSRGKYSCSKRKNLNKSKTILFVWIESIHFFDSSKINVCIYIYIYVYGCIHVYIYTYVDIYRYI